MLRASWEKIATLGTAGEAVGDRRRIRLTNQTAVIGIVSCSAFATAYAIAGAHFRAPMLANILTVVAMFCALAANRARLHTLAKLLVLVPVNLVVLVASMLLGGRVGFLYYFFLFAAVAFILFEHQFWLKWLLALFSVACCAFVRILGEDFMDPAITGHVAVVLDVASALATIATVIFIVHLFTRDTTVAEARLAEEHARSERLLLNILPATIAERLKDEGKPIADGFGEVTVLFADIVGFTELSQKLTPAALVEMLNRIFSAFDDLAAKHGLEKIKTIGDCYMVAAGLPEARADHVAVMARMALGMREALRKVNDEGGYALRIRIGIHTGPVVAGVIGKKKFIYDLWGDTVNTASRMESSGVPGEIQVTAAVHERLADGFTFEDRGTIAVKGKGEMATFLLKGER
jgi:class 3 adenylate cyclase